MPSRRTYKNIAYPDTTYPNTYHFRYVPENNCYEVYTSAERRYLINFNDVKRFISTIVGNDAFTLGTPTYFYPIVGSEDFDLLEAAQKIIPSEREDTLNTFRIKYDALDKNFIVFTPYTQTTYINDSFSSLSEAYSFARKCCNYLNNTTTDLGAYVIKPRRNSNEYLRLLKIETRINYVQNEYGTLPDTSTSELLSLIKNICLDLYDSELNIRSAIDILDMKLGFSNPFYGIKEGAKNKLKSILSHRTGIEFVDIWNATDLIAPKDKTDIIHIVEDENTVKKVRASLKFVSSDCFSCSSCDKKYLKSQQFVGGVRMCMPCAQAEGLYRCDYCDDYHREIEGCPHYNNMPAETVYGYNQDVRTVIPRMYHMDTDKVTNGVYLRYGVELEVIPKNVTLNGTIKQAYRKVGEAMKGYAILKSDSSLTQGGVEIVTVPATLEFHRKKLWNKLFLEKDEAGVVPASYMRSWDTDCCGLHIHITRAALDKMQLAKLLVFYHENENALFLSKIAGRTIGPEAYYCKTRKKRLGSGTVNNCTDHHEAITISRRNHGKTAEVRIFRGNCTKHGVMRSLEFVDATVKWAKQASPASIDIKNSEGQNIRRLNGLSYHAFLTWFDQPDIRSLYPELWKHLIQLSYLKTKHKSYVETDEVLKSGKKKRISKDALDLVPIIERVA